VVVLTTKPLKLRF